MNPDVLVVGAGAAGIGAARALGGLGLNVLVLDRQRSASTVAKGEILQPESVRILDSLGALAGLRATGARAVDQLAIRDPAGQPLLALDYRDLPGQYRQILCAEYAGLQTVLAENLPANVQIRRGARVTEPVRNGAGRVTGVRLVADGAEEQIDAPLVVAADGMSSNLRKAAGIEVQRREYPHRLLAFDVADAEVAAEVTAYRTARGLVLVYPLPGGRCRLYVQVRPDEFRGGTADLSEWFDRLLVDAPAILPLAPAIRASLDRRQLLAVYRLRARRLAVPGLALVGESAHAVHPMAAQGVNSSLADAEVLTAALRTEGSTELAAVDRALTSFAASRQPRLDHLATVSHNASRMITSVSGLPKLLGGRMMRRTAANSRLLGMTAGNLSGTNLRPLSFLDRLYQLGVLIDRHADARPAGTVDLSEA
jgi:2-polyprenyl-6-methoxyphenol hydroxylase-like FAD-dependent oxidoreductase